MNRTLQYHVPFSTYLPYLTSTLPQVIPTSLLYRFIGGQHHDALGTVPYMCFPQVRCIIILDPLFLDALLGVQQACSSLSRQSWLAYFFPTGPQLDGFIGAFPYVAVQTTIEPLFSCPRGVLWTVIGVLLRPFLLFRTQLVGRSEIGAVHFLVEKYSIGSGGRLGAKTIRLVASHNNLRYAEAGC